MIKKTGQLGISRLGYRGGGMVWRFVYTDILKPGYGWQRTGRVAPAGPGGNGQSRVAHPDGITLQLVVWVAPAAWVATCGASGTRVAYGGHRVAPVAPGWRTGSPGWHPGLG